MIMNKKITIMSLATGLCFTSVAFAGTTYALWSKNFDFPATPFSVATAQFGVSDSANSDSTTVLGSPINFSLAGAVKTTLLSSWSAAEAVEIVGATSSHIGIDYSIPSVTTTGAYLDSRVSLNVIQVPDAASCSSSATGTSVYNGAPNGFTMSNSNLFVKPATPPATQTTGSVVLCFQFTAIPDTISYSQTATVTANIVGQPSNTLTANDTFNADVVNAYDTTGDFILNTNWSIVR